MSSDCLIHSPLSPPAAELYADNDVLGTGPLELNIVAVEDLTPRIRQFTLRSPHGGQLPPWTPGAHILVPVELENGHATRHYSLLGDCDARDVYEIAVLRLDDGNGGSRRIHQTYCAGTRLRCELPSNHFELENGDAPCVLIAGGIGITPLHSMAIALTKRGTPFVLHYAARSPRETAFMRDIGDRFGTKANFWHSTGPHPNRLDVNGILGNAPPTSRVYVCGPESLVQAVIESGERHGMPRANIRHELFSPVSGLSRDHAFEVELTREGKVIHVPANQSILDAVLAAGITAEFGCCAGQCGTCAVTVVEGEVDHRDTVLSEEQRTVERRACICVSRAMGPRLVIDL